MTHPQFQKILRISSVVQLSVFLTILSGCVLARIPITLYEIENAVELRGMVFEEGWPGSGHGSVTVNLPDGEIAKGQYTTLSGGSTTVGRIWGDVYGGATVTQTPDDQAGSFIVVGDRGTVLECDYLVTTGNHGRGACKDNKGHLFKLLY